MDIANKRSVVLLGHSHSGKTVLAESMLHLCKATTRKGTIADGTTVSDYNFDEIERKNSISSSYLFCDYQGSRIQIVDIPGYAEFFGEVVSGVNAVDNAIVVVDAASGVQVGTEKAWGLLDELGLPRAIFINKIDKEDANIDSTLAQIKEQLSNKAVLIDNKDSSEIMELAAESDDQLLVKYLSEGTLTPEEVESGLKQGIASGNIFPIIKGSALNDQGVEDLLKLIKADFSNPSQRKKIEAVDPANLEQKKEVVLSEDAPFSAFVFKSIFDPYVGQLSLARIYSGKLTSNTEFYNVSRKSKERFGQLYLLQGKEQKGVDVATCGDIIAIPKLKDTQTQDSLSGTKDQFLFNKMVFPEALISSSVKPKTRQDEEKISQALNKLTLEDLTFTTNRNEATREMIISGLGNLHLQIMVARLKKRFSVEVDLGQPRVAYKETITKTAKVQGRFKRQSGGRGQFGDVWIEISPLERGANFEFVDKIFGGAIPRNFIPSVEKGVKSALSEGAVAGYPIEDVKVVLFDGSYHDVDSSDMAFQIAGGMALRKGVSEAGPVLLEPVMDVEVSIPEEFFGQISGDLNSRRGRIMGMESKGKLQVVKAQVPQSEMFKYANDLRSITGGRGSYTMRYSHYEQVPAKITSNIISQYQDKRKAEEEAKA